MECRKIPFDKKTAKTVLNECKKEHREEKRIYECPICGKWHLTKYEKYEEKIYLKGENLVFENKWKELMK